MPKMSRLVNPYVLPMLYVRKPGDDNETCIKFADDDPFFSEISDFIDILEEERDSAKILSSYEGTYNIPSISNSSSNALPRRCQNVPIHLGYSLSC